MYRNNEEKIKILEHQIELLSDENITMMDKTNLIREKQREINQLKGKN